MASVEHPADPGSSPVPTRTLVVMRHAKAEWPDGPDHERPLAERGRADAAEAGRVLSSLGVEPDLVVCSTAVRTRETWRIAAKEFDRRPHTAYDDRVYEATAQALLYLVHETPGDVGTLMLVGHNPGVAVLVAALAGSSDGDALERSREKYPTAAVSVLTFPGSWTDAAERTARMERFLVPRG